MQAGHTVHKQDWMQFYYKVENVESLEYKAKQIAHNLPNLTFYNLLN